MSSIFQRVYDAIKNYQPPAWIKALLGTLNALALATLKKISYAYLDHLRSLVAVAGSHSDWTGEEKLKYVFSEGKKSFGEFAVTLKDQELNMIIEFLVGEFKKFNEK